MKPTCWSNWGRRETHLVGGGLVGGLSGGCVMWGWSLVVRGRDAVGGLANCSVHCYAMDDVTDLVFATRRILSSTCSVAVRFKEGSVAEMNRVSWFCSTHWIYPPGSGLHIARVRSCVPKKLECERLGRSVAHSTSASHSSRLALDHHLGLQRRTSER